MKCNQCGSTTVNGLYIHEAGCPNTNLGICPTCGIGYRKWIDWSGYESPICTDCAEGDE